MATLADLVVRGRFDPTGIDRGLQQTVRSFNRASRDMRRAFQSRDSFFPNLSGQGKAAAEQMLQGLQRTLTTRTATLSQQLAQKIISPEQFQRRAAFAAGRFNQQLLAGMAELRSRGLLSADLEQRLTSQLSALGRRAGGETARTLAAGIAAHREDIGREIDTALRDSLRSARRTALREGGSILGDVGAQARVVGQALTLGVTAPLVGLAGLAVKDAAEMDSLRRALLAVAGSAPQAEAQLARLKEVAKLPGIGFQEAIRGSVRLQAVGFSAESAERSLRAFANAIALTGGGREQLASVTVQLGQLAAKGKVLAQDLKPIIEASPAVATALKQMFGSVDSEQIAAQLEAAGVSTAQFVELLVTQLEQLPKVSGGVKNSFENLADAAFRARAALGDQLLPAIVPLVERLATLAESAQHVDPALVRSAIAFTAVAAAAGPLLIVLGSLATVFGAVATALGVGLLPVIAVGAPLLIGLGSLAEQFIENKLAALDAASAVDRFRESLGDVAKLDLAQSLGQLRELTDAQTGVLAQRESIEKRIAELEAKRNAALRARPVTLGPESVGAFVPSSPLAGLSRQEQAALQRLRSIRDAYQENLPTKELQKRVDELKKHIQDLQQITGGPDGPLFDPNARKTDKHPFKDEQETVQRLITLYEELRARKRDAAALSLAQGAGEQLAASLANRAAAAPAGSQAQATLLELERQLAQGLEIPLQFEVPASRVEELRRELASQDWTIPVTPTIAVTAPTGTLNLNPVSVSGIQQSVEESRARVQAVLNEAKVARDASVQHFADTVASVRNITSSFGELADALGDVNPAVSGALRGVESLINGLVSIRAGQAQGGMLGTLAQVGGVVGAAAGVAQIVGGIAQSLFGVSEEAQRMEQERRALLEKNNQALDKLRLSLDQTPTGDLFDRVTRALAEVAGGPDGKLRAGVLSQFNLTVSQLAAFAQTLGIDLLDEKGHVVAESFQQLQEALGPAIERLTRFGSTLEEQRSRQSAFNKLFDVKSTPQQQLGDAFAILQQMAPALLQKEGLTNLNLDSEAGRNALLAGLQDIFKLIDGNQLTADLLGAFTGKDQLLDAVLSTKDGLDALAGTADQLNSSFTNLPQGFRIFNAELARFNAQAARTAASLSGSTSSGTVPTWWDPANVPGPRTNPVPASGPQVEYADHRTYSISVMQQPGESGDDFARRVVALVTESAIQDNLAAGKNPTDAWSPNPRKR